MRMIKLITHRMLPVPIAVMPLDCHSIPSKRLMALVQTINRIRLRSIPIIFGNMSGSFPRRRIASIPISVDIIINKNTINCIMSLIHEGIG